MNRQVPNKNNAKSYTIVGDGKVAQHFCEYFSLLGVDYNCWSRKRSNQSLLSKISDSDVILLLISDNAIEKFLQDHWFLKTKALVHFSGALSFKNIIGCHPLMTFSDDLYDLKTYQSIPFVCEDGADFSALFPKLANPFFQISPADKAYYHAMCVMAGNFTQTLMRKSANELNNKLHLPCDILFPYLIQNTLNFTSNPNNSATGPLQRGDFTTVNKHLHALENSPMQGIYQCFINHSEASQLSKKFFNKNKTNEEKSL